MSIRMIDAINFLTSLHNMVSTDKTNVIDSPSINAQNI